MKFKRVLSLFIVIALCLSYFTAFAYDANEALKEIIVETKDASDDPTEELVAMPDDGVDGSIDYSDMSNWAYWNEGKEKKADLFFVCPTVDMGKDGNYISDIENEKYRESFVGAINMELGIYNDVASVYAPYYRQATFPVYSLSEKEQEIYLSFAYEDIKTAFIYYADHTDPSRPLILAGFSQGADLIIRLMKDLFDDPKYQRRLVAAYAIGWRLTEDEVEEFSHIKPAEGETDTGVIIAFNSEDKDITSSLIIGADEKTYAINPLNWKTTAEIAERNLNKGACFTDYSGKVKEEIPNLTGAYIDVKRGALKVTDIKPEDYPGKLFDDGIYHLYDYQFFFRNLQENVKKRLSAYNAKNTDGIDIYYDNEIMNFDVEPIIEKGRTLVPFRAIFETMGCAVYYSVENGKQIVSARRGDDSLILTIGENKMYFNGKEKKLDVPAKIKNGRTIVPVRAISEAFECEVLWQGDTKTVRIDSPISACAVSAEKLSETITDDAGNVLIEVVAYYPVVENPIGIPWLDTINSDYKWDADKFMEEAKAKKEEALALRKEMGNAFKPFVYELTFEQTYNIWGYLSFTNHKYINVGGAHPTKTMESRTYCTSSDEEMSVSKVLIEEALNTSLVKYITNLFVDKLKEIAPESTETYTYDYVSEYLGYVQFYITENSLVLYFNQGELAPYALGVISVEIPYEPELFYIDMRHNCEAEHVFEHEYDKGYEWRVFDYSKDKLAVTEEYTDYPPEEIYSEYYPVGLHRVTVKGIKKGNATIVFAHVKKGEGLETATKSYAANFYVDEDNMLTLVIEDEVRF
ncbi:MAG: DUF3089 domain-containing protein [Clostridia bacterium]|nr:DUF3089 domain-containing protein [Clostridia bacterium]